MKPTAFSVADIGSPYRDRLEDYAMDAVVRTGGGLLLQIAMVCDGVGSSEWGIQAARDTAHVILQHLEEDIANSIPDLLIAAVQQANQYVYHNIRDGSSTVALIAIDLQSDSPYGRLYIASVGDSPIFTIRDGVKLRLNIDHTVANDPLFRAITSNDEQSNRHALTRAVGIDEEITVDVGFYTEKNIDPEQAIIRGRVGLKLKAGDTLLAVSDGLVDRNPKDSRPYVRDNEFVRHALDKDVDAAAKAFINYAKHRIPRDNIAISLVFIPSNRRTQDFFSRITQRQVRVIAIVAIAAVVVLSALVYAFTHTSGEVHNLENTQIAVAANVTGTAFAKLTIAAYTGTPTTTPSVTNTVTPSSTFTITPTSTFTLTPTMRPQAVSGEVGLLYSDNSDVGVRVLEREIITASEDSYMLIDGGKEIDDAAVFFLHSGTQLLFDRVNSDSTDSLINVLLYPGGNVFVYPGQYSDGVVHLSLQQDANISFETSSACISASYLDDQTLAFGCYATQETSCAYELDRTSRTSISAGSQVKIDIVSHTLVNGVDAIPYEIALQYFQVVRESAGLEVVQCIQHYVDQDSDLVFDKEDVCVDVAGLAEYAGCPDSDNDTVPDNRDTCPLVFGTAPNGCPPTETPTATYTPTETPIPDKDGDAVPDSRDTCPLVFGTAPNGCPPTETPTASPTSTNTPIPDSDLDGVPDTIDSCPTEFGVLKNGCSPNR